MKEMLAIISVFFAGLFALNLLSSTNAIGIGSNEISPLASATSEKLKCYGNSKIDTTQIQYVQIDCKSNQTNSDCGPNKAVMGYINACPGGTSWEPCTERCNVKCAPVVTPETNCQWTS